MDLDGPSEPFFGGVAPSNFQRELGGINTTSSTLCSNALKDLWSGHVQFHHSMLPYQITELLVILPSPQFRPRRGQ